MVATFPVAALSPQPGTFSLTKLIPVIGTTMEMGAQLMGNSMPEQSKNSLTLLQQDQPSALFEPKSKKIKVDSILVLTNTTITSYLATTTIFFSHRLKNSLAT